MAAGLSNTVTASTPKDSRKSGVSVRPIEVRMLAGRSESAATMAKNASENRASARERPSAPTSGSTPRVKGTVAQRGMAKKGPMVRYSAHVKHTP